MKKILIIFLCLINFLSFAISLEIKTIVSINNKIITNVDLDNEITILKILNPNQISQEKNIQNIALNNLINENLKKIEIKKNKIDTENEKNKISTQYKELLEKIKKNNLKLNKKIEDTIYSKIELEYQWGKFISNKYSWQININMKEVKNKIDDNKTISEIESIINFEKDKKLNLYSISHLENLKKNSLIKYFK